MPLLLKELMVKYGMPTITFDDPQVKPDIVISQLIVNYNPNDSKLYIMNRNGSSVNQDKNWFTSPDIYQIEVDIDCFAHKYRPVDIANLFIVQLILANPIQNKWLYNCVQTMSL